MTAREDLRPEEIIGHFLSFLKNLPSYLSNSYSDFSKNYWKNFQSVYLSSGLSTYIDDYIKRAKIVIIGSFITSYLISFLILILLRFILLHSIILALTTAIMTVSITAFINIAYPYYKKGEAKGRLEDGLIYFLSYMTVLSASGMSIERILDRILNVEDNPPLIYLSKKFIMNVRLFGMDVRTALKDIAAISPSKTLTKQIESIRTTIATSGDLKTLLTYEVERQLQVKREKLKSKLNTLVYIGELYIAMMVITPTIFILIIAILSVMGGNTLGGSAILQLNLIVFIGIPILGAIFTIILDQTLGREE